MIKYEIKLGSSYLNKIARDYRDVGYKPVLKGMHCRKCSTDTIIKFVKSEISVKHKINACCNDFEQRINDRLFPKRD